MLNLFDMLNQSQNGQGIDQLARQFGLSQQQAQQAVELAKQNGEQAYVIGKVTEGRKIVTFGGAEL